MHPAVPDLADLLRNLRDDDGVVAGVDRRVAAEMLLHRLDRAGVSLTDPIVAADYLAPVLASNPDQQLAVRRRLLALAPHDLAIAAADQGGLSVPLRLQEEAAAVRRRRNELRQSFGALAATVALVLAAVLAIMSAPTEVATNGPAAAAAGAATPWLPHGWLDPLLIPAAVVGLLAYLGVTRLLDSPQPSRASAVPDLAALNRARETPDAAYSHLLRPGPLRGALLGMRAALLPERWRFDLPASISATARAGGLPHLLPESRARVPSYLVLAEMRDNRDQVRLLPEILLRRLRAAALRIEAYTIGADPRVARLWTERRSGTQPLERLLPRCVRHRLLLVSDGVPWWDALADTLTDAAAPMMLLYPRILLTPVPYAVWGAREACFSRAGFTVLPLTPQGLDALARWLESPAENPPPSPPRDARMRDIALELELQASALLDDDLELTASQLALLSDRLHIWLGASGWQLLAAIALYPRPGPGLTARLAARLARAELEPGKRFELDEQTVSRVARLPWLRRGRMPSWLRDMLVPTLAPALRSAVADAYLRFLSGGDAVPLALDHTERARLIDAARAADAASQYDSDGVLLEFLERQALPEAPSAVSWWRLATGRLRVFAAPATGLAGCLLGFVLATLITRIVDTSVLRRLLLQQWGLDTEFRNWAPVAISLLAVAATGVVRPNVGWQRLLPLLTACLAAVTAWIGEPRTSVTAFALGAVVVAASLLVAREKRVALDWNTSLASAKPAWVAVMAVILAGTFLTTIGYNNASGFVRSAVGFTLLAFASARSGLLPSDLGSVERLRLTLLFVGGCVVAEAFFDGPIWNLIPWVSQSAELMADIGLPGGLFLALFLGVAGPKRAWTRPSSDLIAEADLRPTLFPASWLEWAGPKQVTLIRLAALVAGNAALYGAIDTLIGGNPWSDLVIASAAALPTRLLFLVRPLSRLGRMTTVACIAFKYAPLAIIVWTGTWAKEDVAPWFILGFAAEYVAAAWIMTTPPLRFSAILSRTRVWLEALPLLLLCDIPWTIAWGETFRLPWLAVPIAVLLATRHGRPALPAIATMLAPMLVGFALGPYGFTGSPGLFLTALLAARLAADPDLCRAVLAASAPLSRSQLAVIFFVLPWIFVTPSFFGLRLSTDLVVLVEMLLLLLGVSRVPLPPLVRAFAVAFVIGTVLLIAQTLVPRVTPLAFGSLRFGLTPLATLATCLLALLLPRIVPMRLLHAGFVGSEAAANSAARTVTASGPVHRTIQATISSTILLVLHALLAIGVLATPVVISIGPTTLYLFGLNGLLLLTLACGFLKPDTWWSAPALCAGLMVTMVLFQSAGRLEYGIVAYAGSGYLGTACNLVTLTAFAWLGSRLARRRLFSPTDAAAGGFGPVLHAVATESSRIVVLGSLGVMAALAIARSNGAFDPGSPSPPNPVPAQSTSPPVAPSGSPPVPTPAQSATPPASAPAPSATPPASAPAQSATPPAPAPAQSATAPAPAPAKSASPPVSQKQTRPAAPPKPGASGK